MSVARPVAAIIGNPPDIRLQAFDGSSAGPGTASVVVDIRSPRALNYLATGRGSLGLARPSPDGLLLHRLTQAVIADSLRPSEREEAFAAARALVVAATPDDETGPVAWAAWQKLLPHVIALAPAVSDDHDVRWKGIEAVWYHISRGDFRAAALLAEPLYAGIRATLGDEHRDTLAAGTALGVALRHVNRLPDAREILERVLATERRLLGEDHFDTLADAGNLASVLMDMGELDAARALEEQTVAAFRRVGGDDHPDTLRALHNLAVTLASLGDYAAARAIVEPTLAARRRILGDDHPDTISSAANLGLVLRDLGELDAARAQLAQAVATGRRVLGEDHPFTLNTARLLALTLRDLGDHAAADRLDAEFAAARERAKQR